MHPYVQASIFYVLTASKFLHFDNGDDFTSVRLNQNANPTVWLLGIP